MARPEDFVAGLNARPGSLQGRPEASSTAKDIVRQSLENASAENRARIARREEIIAQKLDALRSAAVQSKTNASEEN